jgi:predicted RNase H-like HicB family nuclease
MRIFDFTVVVWKEKEGYVSKCPELGVASCGNSINEAVELYIENAERLGILGDIEESLTSKEKFTSHLEVTYA